MYIIFKVCLEYYLYIKYNNKKTGTLHEHQFLQRIC